VNEPKLITQAELLAVLRSPAGQRRCRELLSGIGLGLKAQLDVDRAVLLLKEADSLLEQMPMSDFIQTDIEEFRGRLELFLSSKAEGSTEGSTE
jgi:hypothetical protein